MSLSIEEKEVYVAFFQELYHNALSVSVDDITLEVAQMGDKMIDTIYQCSKQMIWAHALFAVFYGLPSLSVKSFLIKFGKAAVKNAKKWLDVLNKHRSYRTCVIAVANQYRTLLEMALNGLD